MLVAAVGGVVIALAIALLQTPRYRSVAAVKIRAEGAQSIFTPASAQTDVDALLLAGRAELQGEPVRAAVRKEFGEAPPVEITEDRRAGILAVAVTDTDARRAAAVVKAYVAAYIDQRRQAAVERLTAAGAEVQHKIDDLQREVDGVNAEIDRASGASQITIQGLRARVDSLLAQQLPLKQKAAQLQVDASLQDGGAQLLNPPLVPTSPTSPQPVRYALVGLILGAVSGVGIAFLRDRANDAIRTKEDIARMGGDVPVLGVVPAFGRRTRRDGVILLDEPQAPAAEAYRWLRTTLLARRVDDRPQIIAVTSPLSAEGKTTTAANLAVALAHGGTRVIVVGCDLRRPRLHTFFDAPNDIGLTSILAGQVSLKDAVRSVPGIGRLRLLTSGPVPPNPAELLASERTRMLFDAIVRACDVVLLDCPPVLPVADAAVLARWVDATLVVVAAGRTHQRDLVATLDLLGQVGAPGIGVVLNRVQRVDSYAYSYPSAGTDPEYEPAPLDGAADGWDADDVEDHLPANGQPDEHSYALRRSFLSGTKRLSRRNR